MSDSEGKDITTIQYELPTYTPPLGMSITSTSLVLTDSTGRHFASFESLTEAGKCLLGTGMGRDVVDHVLTQTKLIQERTEVEVAANDAARRVLRGLKR